MITKKPLSKLRVGTIEYVIAHWDRRKKRGKKHPSATLQGMSNPRKSLRLARQFVSTEVLNGEIEALNTELRILHTSIKPFVFIITGQNRNDCVVQFD